MNTLWKCRTFCPSNFSHSNFTLICCTGAKIYVSIRIKQKQHRVHWFFFVFFLMQKNESDILQPEPMLDSTSRHKPTSVSVSGALSKYPTQFCTLLQWMVEFSSLCGTTGIPLFRQYSPSLILIQSLSFLLSQSRQKCGFTLNSKLQLIRSLYNP